MFALAIAMTSVQRVPCKAKLGFLIIDPSISEWKRKKNIQKAIDGDLLDDKKRLTNFLLTCEQYLKK